MSEVQSFLARASDRLIETNVYDLEGTIDRNLEATDDGLERANDNRIHEVNGGGITSLWSSTPPHHGRAPRLRPPTEKAWATFFKINVAFTILWAAWTLARRALAAAGSEYPDTRMGYVLDDVYDFGICGCIASVALAYELSRWMLRVMSTFSKQILQIGFVVFVLASGMVVNRMLASNAVLCATVTAAVCTGVGHVFIRRGRIAFAAQNLKVAARAVSSVPKVFMWSICLAVIRFVLLVAAGVAVVGSIAEFSNVRGPDGTIYRGVNCKTTISKGFASCECNGDIISKTEWCEKIHGVEEIMLICFWMASMGWVFVACTNVMTATVARSVFLWWSSKEDVESVLKSCQYVTNSSLGTLCKGSAIDGVIEILNEGVLRLPPLSGFLVGRAKFFLPGSDYLHGILQTGAEWLPRGTTMYLVQPLGLAFGLPLMLVKIVSSYVMGYSAVFVGMHGLRLSEGLGRTKELFRTIGMTLVINEVVVGVGLLVTGLAPTGFFCYAMSRLSGGWDAVGWAILWSSALKIHLAFVVVLLPMLEVVLCAYKVVFVCFLQSPEAFSDKHDQQLIIGLRRAWQTTQMSHPARRDADGDGRV